MSSTAFASSLASLSHTPVRSSDFSFFTSSGRSSDMNRTSISTRVPSLRVRVNRLLMGESCFTSAADHSIHVLIVVDFSSG